jgi:hypothetical protein
MADPVLAGPRWYRTRIRRYGPFLALLLPLALGAIDAAVRQFLDGRLRGWTSLILRVCAAPGLLVVGYPFATSSERPFGVVLSIPIWLVVGYAAAAVATRNPVATFRDFWRSYFWLAGAVFVGAGAALVMAGALLGRSLV